MVTAYELACGAVDIRRKLILDRYPATDYQLTLWREHGTYHVRLHNFSEHSRVFWDSFNTLAQARKRFAAAVREYKL